MRARAALFQMRNGQWQKRDCSNSSSSFVRGSSVLEQSTEAIWRSCASMSGHPERHDPGLLGGRVSRPAELPNVKTAASERVLESIIR